MNNKSAIIAVNCGENLSSMFLKFDICSSQSLATCYLRLATN